MARRPNYGGEKRQKEIQRQKKRDEKAEKKRLKKEAATAGNQGEEVVDGAGTRGTASVESEPDSDERSRDASH